MGVVQESQKLPTMKEFDDYVLQKCKREEWYDAADLLRNGMIAKKSFLVLSQLILIAFLLREAFRAY